MMKQIHINLIENQELKTSIMKSLNKSLALLSLFLLLGYSVSAQHFQTIWSGNPYLPMNIFVNSASLDGLNLQAADEIAIFDVDASSGDEICVGLIVLDSEFLPSGYLDIKASADDPTTPGIQDGFLNGNTIIYRFWDDSKSEEITLMEISYHPDGDDIFTDQGTATVTLVAFSKLIWTGVIDSDWHNPGNWDTNNTLIPDAGTYVEIPASTTTFPVVSNGDAECKTLIAETGVTVTVSGSYELYIAD